MELSKPEVVRQPHDPGDYTFEELQQIEQRLRKYGIPVSAHDMADLKPYQIQPVIVELFKDWQLPVEEVGKECFGEKWDANRWI